MNKIGEIFKDINYLNLKKNSMENIKFIDFYVEISGGRTGLKNLVYRILVLELLDNIGYKVFHKNLNLGVLINE